MYFTCSSFYLIQLLCAWKPTAISMCVHKYRNVQNLLCQFVLNVIFANLFSFISVYNIHIRVCTVHTARCLCWISFQTFYFFIFFADFHFPYLMWNSEMWTHRHHRCFVWFCPIRWDFFLFVFISHDNRCCSFRCKMQNSPSIPLQ